MRRSVNLTRARHVHEDYTSRSSIPGRIPRAFLLSHSMCHTLRAVPLLSRYGFCLSHTRLALEIKIFESSTAVLWDLPLGGGKRQLKNADFSGSLVAGKLSSQAHSIVAVFFSSLLQPLST